MRLSIGASSNSQVLIYRNLVYASEVGGIHELLAGCVVENRQGNFNSARADATLEGSAQARLFRDEYLARPSEGRATDRERQVGDRRIRGYRELEQ